MPTLADRKKQPLTSPPPNIHFETIKNAIPKWLSSAPPEIHQQLRNANLQPPAWFEKARLAMPAVAKQLQGAHAAHLANEHYLNKVLANLPSLEVFAAPLLTAAIWEKFGLTVDVRTCYLFHAQRVQVDQSFGAASKDPLVMGQNALKAATQPLLQAALQNFEAWEAEPGAMDDSSTRKAAIYEAYPIVGIALRGTVLPIPPEQFAALCRTLDLGAQYQAQITRVFNPAARPGDAPDSAESNLRGHFRLFEASAFTLQVHIARLQNVIGSGQHSALLEVARNKSAVTLDGQRLTCSFLTLWDIQLTGIVVLGSSLDASHKVEKIIVYIPDDPFFPLKQYDSTRAFNEALRDRLVQPAYKDFFQRFVPARHRSRLTNKLKEVFYPKVWNKGGWYEQVLDKEATLQLSATPFSAPFLSELYRQKIAGLRDDGLFNAVPSAAEDHKSAEDKLLYFANTTLQVLNVAAFVVPVLGVVMLAVTAAQLCYEVYEGVESLVKGDKEQAWGYLLDVAENVALMAALGAASSSAGGIAAVKAPPLIEQMRPVQLPTGGIRLWKPDLTPFAHDIVIPASLKPNALGLYQYQDQQWLALDGSTYAVKGSAPYYLQHPTRADAYEPKLRHNNAGAWLHELDQPLDWQGLALFRRLGRATAEFSDSTAKRILDVSATHEAILRRALAEGERPPALLEDTMQRFQLDQELATQITADESVHPHRNELFEARYQALQTSDSAGITAIQKAYPGLPKAVIEELLAHATPAELQQWALNERLPLRLAEEARVYQQQVRLTRAFEGFYLESVSNPDTNSLLLHSLETLPGWSPDVRLEVRNGAFSGPLLDSIGPTDAPIRKILIKDADGYEPRDADDQHLHGRADLYAAVMHALPDAQRQALGLPHASQGADLKSALQAQPLMPRQTLADILHMQPIKPGSKSPMRLADGRLGYPLSGRGALQGYLVRETLLDKVRILELPHPPEQTLRALEGLGLTRVQINQRLDQLLGEHQALRNSLELWASASASRPQASAAQALNREHIGAALWEHWQTSNLPEIGRASGFLRLDSTSLADFPEQLPAFVHDRVQALQLDDVTVGSADVISDYEALARFFRRFPQVNSLAIARRALTTTVQPMVFGIATLVADSFSEIRDLRLINQRMLLSQAEINTFRRMEHLQILDLSGNSLGVIPPSDLTGLNLRYLGLDRMALVQWPEWLDSQLPTRIAELSMDDNHITDLPDSILDNAPLSEYHTRISLRGNVLARATIIRARMGDTGAHGRYSFDLDVPPALEGHLNELLQQRQELHEAFFDWEHSPASTPRTEVQIRNRRDTGLMLRRFWRNMSEERGLGILDLQDIAIGEFPHPLPDFFYTNVRFLEMDKVHAPLAELDDFLRRFSRLEDLTLTRNVLPLTQLPTALLDLPALSTFRLLNQGMMIDQAAIGFLGRLPALEHLELDGNVMGSITDISGLAARRLRWLALNNVGMQTWPDWLNELISSEMEILNLESNQLTTLPEHVLQNPHSHDGHLEIGLQGNPLSHESMLRAHTSENYGHRYSFSMDLPADILAIDYDSDRSNSGRSTPHGHSPGSLQAQELTVIEPWLTGAIEEEPQRRAIWQQLESSNDAQDLLNMVGRLQHTADYRALRSRPELTSRVWRVLAAAAQDTELRLTLNGMSEEPLRLLQHYDTCPDGIRLEFNQMEILIYTRQALLDAPIAQRGQSLYRLTQRLYRLHELDRIARVQAGQRDEAEVRLAYRLRWATELDLPLPPGSMLYRIHAQLRPGELDNALRQVQQGEQSLPFLTYAGQRDFWVEYLRETYAPRFRPLKDAFEARVTELLDLYPGDNPDQTAARISALEHQFKSDEQNLIRELTNREGIDQV